MQTFRALSELGSDPTPSVVTVGNFDGVHCGHRTVLAAVTARARELGARAVAVTFDPHPAVVLHAAAKVRLLTPLSEKLSLLAAAGVDATLVLPFTPEFSQWTAEEFVARVLRDALHAVEVHEGETFRFGYQAARDVVGLAELGRSLGFAVRTYEPVMLRGAAVSSSRIRTSIAEGRIETARALLGRPYSLFSTPARGRGYGTKYAVPTINLAFTADDANAHIAQQLPAHGVYITTLTVNAGTDRGQTFRGVTNAGNRPTFGADSYAIETHLLNFAPIDLSEETPLELRLLHRLRGEQRFESPEALRAQIGRDVAKAQRFFALATARAAKL
jgi:riboflavin kinase/FMN adenylyltransferase